MINFHVWSSLTNLLSLRCHNYVIFCFALHSDCIFLCLFEKTIFAPCFPVSCFQHHTVQEINISPHILHLLLKYCLWLHCTPYQFVAFHFSLFSVCFIFLLFSVVILCVNTVFSIFIVAVFHVITLKFSYVISLLSLDTWFLFVCVCLYVVND